MYRDFLDIVGGKSDATVEVECNFYEVTGMCIVLCMAWLQAKCHGLKLALDEYIINNF